MINKIKYITGSIPLSPLHLLFPAGYILLGILFFLPLIRNLNTHILADDLFFRPGQSDAFNMLWSYWWVHEAVLDGESIFHCGRVLPPSGAGLVFHTIPVLPSILTLPVALLSGTVRGFNIMVMSMIVAGAVVYGWFLRTVWKVSGVSSFFIGVCFGFSPYFPPTTKAKPSKSSAGISSSGR